MSGPAAEPPLLSIADAAQLGIERLREQIWANPLDHLKIDIIDTKPGPWVHLWCPANQEISGRDPLDLLCYRAPFDLTERVFVRYAGPLPDSAEYRAEVARIAGRTPREPS